jgi:hypothetical protein
LREGEQVEVIPEETVYEDVSGAIDMGVVDDGCTSCGAAGCGGGCLVPCPILIWDNLEISAGVQGFTGPTNRGDSGSFGFHESVNWSAPFPCLDCWGIGAQFGARAVQSNLSGAGSALTLDQREQLFVTAGGFRRVDWGLQGGVVIDYLFDEWYHEVNLAQLRGEMSWMFPYAHEFGFWFTSSLQSDTQTFDVGAAPTTETFVATDIYAFFYRYRHDCGGDGRIFAGFTGDSDGFLGAEFELPLCDSVSVRSGFAYLIPEQSTNNGGDIHESWNVGLSLVWRPGCPTGEVDYYRPLFNVADNGSFLVDR